MMSFMSIIKMIPQADEPIGIKIFCLIDLLLIFINIFLKHFRVFGINN